MAKCLVSQSVVDHLSNEFDPNQVSHSYAFVLNLVYNNCLIRRLPFFLQNKNYDFVIKSFLLGSINPFFIFVFVFPFCLCISLINLSYPRHHFCYNCSTYDTPMTPMVYRVGYVTIPHILCVTNFKIIDIFLFAEKRFQIFTTGPAQPPTVQHFPIAPSPLRSLHH